MQTTLISDILIPEYRQRRDFSPAGLLELQNSIKAFGLFHAIILRDDGRTLVSGERRLRALATLSTPYTYNGIPLQPGFVPYTRLSDLTPLELREAELEENTIRMDLTWQERDSAIAALHSLRMEQAEIRGETQTRAKTVEELLGRPEIKGEGSRIVSNAMLVTAHLHDPEVSGAKTQKEALNIVRRKVTAEYNANLADELREAMSKSPHTLLRGDARTILPTLASATFDIICTDPPYGIDAHAFAPLSGSSSGAKHEYDDTLKNASEVWASIFQQGARLCKPEAHLYMFFDLRHWEFLRQLATSCGWVVWPRPIIWHKPTGGMLGDSAHGPRPAYEPILFASRGQKRVTAVYFDLVSIPSNPTRHAAEKPKELIVNLLRRSCAPGDGVLDPCAGSGTIFEAATQLSLFATGIELVEQHYNTALTRMVPNALPMPDLATLLKPA
jgi:DNA modification methylase